ncbi:hypothetical protein ABS71_12095 [bacterium SCN 62-11]|nr:glycosyltransferase family 2 protein [Candidatus Eremiobacteraeota bacterium]ODT65631.1 MAG: hypothetical protein ABS71_12095 [bacterium SCN 62-11]
MNRSGDEEVEISVLVSTRGRPGPLLDLCRSLRASLPPGTGCELVLAINDCPSAYPSLDELRLQLPDWCKLVGFHEGRPGKSRALNGAIHASRGRLLAFLDDDVLVEPDWILQLRRAFTDPNIQAIGGGVEVHLEHPAPFWWTTHCAALFGCTRTWPFLEGQSIPYLCGSNMAVRREAVVSFWEDIGPGTQAYPMGEDLLFAREIQRRGNSCVYYPSCRVRHLLPKARLTWSQLALRGWYTGGMKYRFEPKSGIKEVANSLARIPIDSIRLLQHLLEGRRAEASDRLLWLVRHLGLLRETTRRNSVLATYPAVKQD